MCFLNIYKILKNSSDFYLKCLINSVHNYSPFLYRQNKTYLTELIFICLTTFIIVTLTWFKYKIKWTSIYCNEFLPSSEKLNPIEQASYTDTIIVPHALIVQPTSEPAKKLLNSNKSILHEQRNADLYLFIPPQPIPNETVTLYTV